MSATNEVIKALPIILKSGQPMTQANIWSELIKDEQLKPMLFTTTGTPRKGVLQGISTRIKEGKLKGLAMVSNQQGHTAIAYTGVTVKDRLTHYQSMLDELSNLDIKSDLKGDQLKTWESLMVQVVYLRRKLAKFADNTSASKPTETFHPSEKKSNGVKKSNYPISKFKNKSNK